jgi:hypothetical protein
MTGTAVADEGRVTTNASRLFSGATIATICSRRFCTTPARMEVGSIDRVTSQAGAGVSGSV